jgi:hypothetical protein
VTYIVGVTSGGLVLVGSAINVGVEAVSTMSGTYPLCGPIGGTVGGGATVLVTYIVGVASGEVVGSGIDVGVVAISTMSGTYPLCGPISGTVGGGATVLVGLRIVALPGRKAC